MQLSFIDLITEAETRELQAETVVLPDCPWCNVPARIMYPDRPEAWVSTAIWHLSCSAQLAAGTSHGCIVNLKRGAVTWSNRNGGVQNWKRQERALAAAEVEGLHTLLLGEWEKGQAEREAKREQLRNARQTEPITNVIAEPKPEKPARSRKPKAEPAPAPRVSPVITKLIQIGKRSALIRQNRTVEVTQQELARLEADLLDADLDIERHQQAGNEALVASHQSARAVIARWADELRQWLSDQSNVCLNQTHEQKLQNEVKPNG